MEKIKQSRYVAYFDMLGYKTATKRNPEKAWEFISSLEAAREEIEKLGKLGIKLTATNTTYANRVQVFILADSVLMFTAEDTEVDLIAILLFASELFSKCLAKHVPLRGGIAHGEFFYNLDKKLYCGRPFIEAYELEKCAEWSGVIVSEKIYEDYKRCRDERSLTCGDGTDILVSWKLPLKNDQVKDVKAINWIGSHKRNFSGPRPILVEQYYKHFSPFFGPWEDLRADVQFKYKNTVEFINYWLNQGQQPPQQKSEHF